MEKIQRKPQDFSSELNQMEATLSEVTLNYQNLSKEHFIRGTYARWHIHGLIYHCHAMIARYDTVADELLKRLNTLDKVHVFIMHTPAFQELMYEFYAFINLSKITLDNLRYILYPLFETAIGQLPKSISDMESGRTDCPVFERISQTEELQYLIDMRNCLVHYRTFATSSNSFVVLEETDISEIERLDSAWIYAMAKGMYRITEKNDVVFNIYIPDKIFERVGNSKKLVNFTYKQGLNLLSESMRFLRHIFFNYLESMSLNLKSQEKVYHFAKKGGLGPVPFMKLHF